MRKMVIELLGVQIKNYQKVLDLIERDFGAKQFCCLELTTKESIVRALHQELFRHVPETMRSTLPQIDGQYDWRNPLFSSEQNNNVATQV